MTTRTDFRGLNGHDVMGAHHNRQGETVYVTRPGDMPRMGWLRRAGTARRGPGRPGAGMIGTATALLFLLGAGLLGVSLAAQYAYLLRERHQHTAALIEALALDVGMLIFSLLALGLARSGKSARIERVLIVACAAGSAVMNFAAANDGSAKSVLAYCMPPVFLAVVADRVISVVRRHYLGDEERSAWSGLGRAALYGLRLTVAAPSTVAGARRALLVATPLPLAAAPRPLELAKSESETEDQPGGDDLPPSVLRCYACGHDVPPSEAGVGEAHLVTVGATTGTYCPGGMRPVDAEFCIRCCEYYPATCRRCPACVEPEPPRPPREGTKTAQFLDLVREKYGPLADLDLGRVGAISAELAPEVDLHPGSARTALRQAIIAESPATRAVDEMRRAGDTSALDELGGRE